MVIGVALSFGSACGDVPSVLCLFKTAGQIILRGIFLF